MIVYPWHHLFVKNLLLKLVGEEASILEESEHSRSQAIHVFFGHLAADYFFMSINTLLSLTLFTLLLSFVDSQALPFFFFHAFDFRLL